MCTPFIFSFFWVCLACFTQNVWLCFFQWVWVRCAKCLSSFVIHEQMRKKAHDQPKKNRITKVNKAQKTAWKPSFFPLLIEKFDRKIYPVLCFNNEQADRRTHIVVLQNLNFYFLCYSNSFISLKACVCVRVFRLWTRSAWCNSILLNMYLCEWKYRTSNISKV